jgi:GntR family transcriptional repressor for pyruvate dehydrogenase complex
MRASKLDLDSLAAALERMRTGIENLKIFVRADLDFHNALAAAAGNETLVGLLHVVRSLLQVYADRAVHDDRAHALRSPSMTLCTRPSRRTTLTPRPQ